MCINAQKNKVTDENLSPMNRVAMDLYVEFSNNVEGEEFSILLIGNSILWHGKAPDIGWVNECGMAASSAENDYAHILFRKLESLMPDRKIKIRLTNAAPFERDMAAFDFNIINKIKQGFISDFIVFQLGENVPYNMDSKLYEEKYTSFINEFKKGNKAVTLCTTPFFPDLKKSIIGRKVALNTKSFLVDLSALSLLDEENLAKNEKDYPLDRSQWKVEGIGLHPGNKGMDSIAETIFIVINATIKSRE
jgi:hypothetical protein